MHVTLGSLKNGCFCYRADVLKALEDNNDSSEVCAAPLLGVTSYGVSMTTLEEVFLQLEDTSEADSVTSSDDLDQPQVTIPSRVERGRHCALHARTLGNDPGQCSNSGQLTWTPCITSHFSVPAIACILHFY